MMTKLVHFEKLRPSWRTIPTVGSGCVALDQQQCGSSPFSWPFLRCLCCKLSPLLLPCLQTKNAVMIERPEPPPTHMAVAIVPVQVPQSSTTGASCLPAGSAILPDITPLTVFRNGLSAVPTAGAAV